MKTENFGSMVGALLLLLGSGALAATTRPSVELAILVNTRGENSALVDNFPVSGSIDISATGQDAQPLAGWELDVVGDAGLYQSVGDVVLETQLPAQVEPGHPSRIPFKIVFSLQLAKLVRDQWGPGQTPVETLKIFNPGDHQLRAVLRPKNSHDLATGVIQSKEADIKIGPGYSSGISGTDIRILVNHADGEIRRRILDRYVENGVLKQADLLAMIENTDPMEKGHLSELYSQKHFDLAQLHNFFPLTDKIMNEKVLGMDEKATRPWFLEFTKGEKITVAWERLQKNGDLTIHIGDEIRHLQPGVMGQGDFHMPSAPGVYPASEDVSGRIWGWVLIR